MAWFLSPYLFTGHTTKTHCLSSHRLTEHAQWQNVLFVTYNFTQQKMTQCVVCHLQLHRWTHKDTVCVCHTTKTWGDFCHIISLQNIQQRHTVCHPISLQNTHNKNSTILVTTLSVYYIQKPWIHTQTHTLTHTQDSQTQTCTQKHTHTHTHPHFHQSPHPESPFISRSLSYTFWATRKLQQTMHILIGLHSIGHEESHDPRQHTVTGQLSTLIRMGHSCKILTDHKHLKQSIWPHPLSHTHHSLILSC